MTQQPPPNQDNPGETLGVQPHSDQTPDNQPPSNQTLDGQPPPDQTPSIQPLPAQTSPVKPPPIQPPGKPAKSPSGKAPPMQPSHTMYPPSYSTNSGNPVGQTIGPQPQPLTPPPRTPGRPPHPQKKPKKPYEEIGAFFNGNEVKIRIPKSTSKPPKLTPSQIRMQQECTCEDDASQCSETCGYGDLIDGPGNLLNFQIPDDICESLTNRTAMNSELVYNKKETHNALCNVCNVTPKDAPKGVKAHKVLHPDKDVFLLKIGKQTDEPNRTGNIEVELVTPRAPAKKMPAHHMCQQIQCEEDDFPCCSPCAACRNPGTKRRIIARKPRKPKCCSRSCWYN